MSSILIKDFPDDLHRALKAESAMRGQSMKQFLIELIERELEKPKRRRTK